MDEPAELDPEFKAKLLRALVQSVHGDAITTCLDCETLYGGILDVITPLLIGAQVDAHSQGYQVGLRIGRTGQTALQELQKGQDG